MLTTCHFPFPASHHPENIRLQQDRHVTVAIQNVPLEAKVFASKGCGNQATRLCQTGVGMIRRLGKPAAHKAGAVSDEYFVINDIDTRSVLCAHHCGLTLARLASGAQKFTYCWLALSVTANTGPQAVDHVFENIDTLPSRKRAELSNQVSRRGVIFLYMEGGHGLTHATHMFPIAPPIRVKAPPKR